MFPLSENFIEFSQFALLFSICAVSYSVALMRKRDSIISIIIGVSLPLIVCVSFYKWMIYGTNYDSISYALLFIGLCLLLLASAFWAIVVNFGLPFLMRLNPRFSNWKPGILLSLFLAILPSFVLSSLAFERQITPDTACVKEGISVVLGQQTYFLRPDFSAHLYVTQTNEFDSMQLRYSTSSKHKESLKIACRVSQDGTVPLPVHRLSFHPSSAYKDLMQRCTDGWPNAANICMGLTEANYQHMGLVNFTENPAQLLLTMASWFQHVDDPEVLTGGDMQNGFVCWGDESKDEKIHCTVWFPIDNNITVVANSAWLRGVRRVDLVEQVRDAVEFSVQAISQ